MSYQLVRTHPEIPLTQPALDAAKLKLVWLRTQKKEAQLRLNDAREQGDLSENGAYKYAKLELASLNRQLREVRFLLDNGVVTEKSNNTTQAQFGHTVTITDGKAKMRFTLVTHHESNPSQGKLSIESPIGASLLGKKVGEVTQVKTPAAEISYTILAIE